VTLLERNTAATAVELDITDVAAITIVRTAPSACLLLLSSFPSSCKTTASCCAAAATETGGGGREEEREGEGDDTGRVTWTGRKIIDP
jgi:glucose-6-phosphate dehydrogenase assembly protein OpcA